jgi:XRE family transcriptional regulator, regulator of sulfur utilization
MSQIQIDHSVSENLKSARKAQNLSLDQLSARSGVSKSMLRQIEIGRSSPTISVLWKIANGLRMPFSALLSSSHAEAEVAGFTTGGQVRAGQKGYRLFPMVTFQPDRPVEIYYVEIDEGVAFEGEPHQGKARETVFVMSGKVDIFLGETLSSAHEEQFVQFQAGQPHRYVNPGRKMARLIMSIDYAV